MGINICFKIFLAVFALMNASAVLGDLPVFKVPSNPTHAMYASKFTDLPASALGDWSIVGAGEMRIMKRNPTSGLFYTRFMDSTLQCNAVATNGNWFACSSDSQTTVFTFNDVTSNYGTMQTFNEVYQSAQFLSDGSLVLVNETTVVTRVNDGSTWNIVDMTAVHVHRENDGLALHLTDTTLALADGNIAYLMLRNQNYSWSLVEQVPVLFNETRFPLKILWINDTVVVSYIYHAMIIEWSSGVQVLVKDGDMWNLVLDTEGEGYVELNGGVGISLAVLSDNKILINAFFDGSAQREFFGVGSVMVLERGSDRQWNITSLLQPDVRDQLWGIALLKTDRDLLVWSCRLLVNTVADVKCGFTQVPLCFSEPIEVTCIDQNLADCSSMKSFKTDDLFHVQNSCGETEVASHVSFSAHGLQVSLEFSRYSVQLASCNATVTCSN